MFTSGSLLRTYFTVGGNDFCVDTAVILYPNNRLDFETMFFRMVKDDVVFDESFDESHATSFEDCKRKHEAMVKKYTVPFGVTHCETDDSGIDRVLKELSESMLQLASERKQLEKALALM